MFSRMFGTPYSASTLLTTLAAGSFDQTGTTHIGKWLVNHSFMVPGLVATSTATVAAIALSSLLLR